VRIDMDQANGQRINVGISVNRGAFFGSNPPVLESVI